MRHFGHFPSRGTQYQLACGVPLVAALEGAAALQRSLFCATSGESVAVRTPEDPESTHEPRSNPGLV